MRTKREIINREDEDEAELTLQVQKMRVHPVLQPAPLWIVDSVCPGLLPLVQLRPEQPHLLTNVHVTG